MVNYFTAGAASLGKLLIESDGMAWRPLVHIGDISRAFLAALDAPASHVNGEIFNVGSLREDYQVRDLADIVRRVLPSCEVEYADGAGPDARSYRIDAGKIERALGFQLQWNVEAGVREMKQAFERYGLKPTDLDGPRFHRMPKWKALLAEGAVGEDMSVRSAVSVEG